MSNGNDFDALAVYLNKYVINVENYRLSSSVDNLDDRGAGTNDSGQNQNDFDEIYRKLTPTQCIWTYLDRDRLQLLLEIDQNEAIRKFIDEQIDSENLKGIPRIIFIKLMYSVLNFSKTANFDVEKTAAVLSQFYLTHKLFVSVSTISAEKLYLYFKELTFCHCLPFPPDKIKLFDFDDVKIIVTYFCKMYLKNLPIVKFLTSPNLAFSVNYEFFDEQTTNLMAVSETTAGSKKGKKKGAKEKKKKKKSGIKK